MTKEERKSMRQFTSWKKRCGKIFRKDDTGGRPIPDSVKEYGRRKPYGGYNETIGGSTDE